jgi:hypothetical protein
MTPVTEWYRLVGRGSGSSAELSQTGEVSLIPDWWKLTLPSLGPRTLLGHGSAIAQAQYTEFWCRRWQRCDALELVREPHPTYERS